MLTIWQAALLGAIQGGTEFLPISSSGHLVVAQQLLGWQPENGLILAYDIALHIGTLISVLIIFRKDVLNILTGKNWRLMGELVLATLPAVVVGFTLKDFIEGMFSSVLTVGIAWIFTSIFLFLTKFAKNGERDSPGWKRSLIIGCAQAVAITPGISRSGSTIAAGLFTGLKKPEAARFAFLMSIPAILGSAVLDAKELTAFPAEMLWQVIVGVFCSAAAGYLCIKWLLRIISKGQFWWFSVYCLLAGIFTIAISLYK